MRGFGSIIVVMAAAVVLGLVARKAFAAGNACDTMVNNANTANPSIACGTAQCGVGNGGQCGKVTVMNQGQVELYSVQVDPNTGVQSWQTTNVVLPANSTQVQYCACIVPGSNPPTFVGEHQCCRVVIAGTAGIGASGVCGAPFCPPGIKCVVKSARNMNDGTPYLGLVRGYCD